MLIRRPRFLNEAKKTGPDWSPIVSRKTLVVPGFYLKTQPVEDGEG